MKRLLISLLAGLVLTGCQSTMEALNDLDKVGGDLAPVIIQPPQLQFRYHQTYCTAPMTRYASATCYGYSY